MVTFSPSDAALEGFQVLRRHWRAIVGWALFNVVALVALAVAFVVVLIGVAPFAGTREAAGAWGGLLGGVILGLGGAAVEFAIWCALLRLELAPDAPGFIHLRLGRDELRVFGAALLVGVVSAPLLVALTFVVRAAMNVSLVAGFAAAAAGLVAFDLVILRFGLTPVIAFAERRISLPESWRRTRGQTWRLFGMAVLLLFLMLLLAALVWLAMFVVSGLATGFSDFGLSGREAFTAHPGRYLFETGVQLLLAPVWIVIGQAPWIAVYRALAPDRG